MKIEFSPLRKFLFVFLKVTKCFTALFIFILQINFTDGQTPDQEKDMIKVDEVIDNLKKETPEDSLKGIPLTKKEKKAKKIKEGKMVISPYIAPAYSPELEFAISGGALVTFSTKPSDSLLTRSSVPVAFTISSNGSKLLTSYWTTFFLSNKLLLTGIFQFRDLSDQYYGVGFENGLHTDYPDSTHYKRRYWQLYGKPMWKISKTMYLGFVADFNFTEAYDINEHMARDPDYLRDGPKNKNSGVGAAISYDTRDFPQNAYSGAMVALSYTRYSEFFKGENIYQVLDLEYRKFFSLSNKKAGRILAIDFHARHCFNDVPYGELSYSGSSSDIRGYRTLRFRDRVSNNIVVEYRHKFYGNSFMAKRSGFVVWGAVGSIGPETGKSFFVNTLPNAGVGYRFEVEHRLNVRIDIGFGRNSSGVYFNFQEAY
jgi:hypothetical protein